jgi:hypothetical protein
MPRTAEKACCSSVVFERPHENTSTQQFHSTHRPLLETEDGQLGVRLHLLPRPSKPAAAHLSEVQDVGEDGVHVVDNWRNHASQLQSVTYDFGLWR